MAGETRHLKSKGGRFYARVAVPEHLREMIGRTELTKPLGGERRAALKALPAAVTELRKKLDTAERQISPHYASILSTPITTQDYGLAVWGHYLEALQRDETTREGWPTSEDIEAATAEVRDSLPGGHLPEDGLERLAILLDLMVKAGAPEFDRVSRKAKLAELQRGLNRGETHLIEHEVEAFLDANALSALPGSAERKVLARQMMRAEIEALTRAQERDQGNYSGTPTDPIVRPPSGGAVEAPVAPLPIMRLFQDYISFRQALGKHSDGGKNWENVVLHLISFLGHSNAVRVTKRNLLDWRDQLHREGKSPKTIADKYLACIRALFKWAFENDRLAENVAATVHQPVGKITRTRERGYTDDEATALLRASVHYIPAKVANPAQRESEHIVRAKRWLPVLCAFTGARVVEIAQLRKEDLRRVDDTWVIRINPDAGSVKSGLYRDVPLHRQVLDLGFVSVVTAASPGPLFHASRDKQKFLSAARVTAGRVSQWLQGAQLVPAGVQPSHGWRHRFKTQTRELGLSDRIADAIQGHAGRTASDDYGDVSIRARTILIEALPEYDLRGEGCRLIPAFQAEP